MFIGRQVKQCNILDMPYLHISNEHGKNYLTYSDLISLVFFDNKIEKIDAGLFISTNGTCSAPTSKKIYKGVKHGRKDFLSFYKGTKRVGALTACNLLHTNKFHISLVCSN